MININQSGAVLCGLFRPREPSFLCVTIITASMKLYSAIFTVRHSPYLMSEFELSRPSECRENGWEHFFVMNENMNMKKDNENSRPLNLVHVSCAL